MWNVSFPKKYVDITKTYHSYVRIVTQTSLAKYRELLKKKQKHKVETIFKLKSKQVK
jgi:hypothetical protein